VCCSVLLCVAGCCSELHESVSTAMFVMCAAVWCSVLQCVAVCCSVLQCVAVHCSTLLAPPCPVLQCVAACCSVLQQSVSTAMSVYMLQCAEVCCSKLQCMVICFSAWYSDQLRVRGGGGERGGEGERGSDS